MAATVSDVSRFTHESGGHRWQRIPPNEKRGRVHTSTVTVVVLREPSPVELVIADRDLEYKMCRGSGNGGQHRQKTDSAVQLRHLPTGLMVRCENERSQSQNKRLALQELRARLFERQLAERAGQVASDRRSQAGTGMRGDKVRTIRQQDGIVTDHRLGTKMPYRNYAKGEIDALWR